MPNAPRSPLSRRGILAAGGALGLTSLLAACGDDKGSKGEGGSGGGKESGPWSFKDDRGKTAKADSTPKNIVAFTGTAAALYDYGILCKAVFGPTTTKGGKPDVQAGNLPVDKVEILGNAWGKFNIEKYAALSPDLLVSSMFLKDTLWSVPDDSKDKIYSLAPSVGLMVAETTLTEPLRRHEQLAESLGADLKAEKVTKAKKRFEDAAERLRKVAKANKDIKVLVGSGSDDLFYVSAPKPSADLRYFQELGVNIVVPKKLSADGFFEELSWENADKYDADIILLDNRTQALQPKALEAKPTWKKLAAVKAGQVIPRVTEPIYSYEACAPILEDLAKAIESAKKVS
ncbi:ABC transporter substrate-binding protein [Streptomyces boninensis]|uniref:ABC transporter substrate-binding protein n=1 Tax=Streptomyces boninensis TaxID=2039455 RepID=UPI003B2228D8